MSEATLGRVIREEIILYDPISLQQIQQSGDGTERLMLPRADAHQLDPTDPFRHLLSPICSHETRQFT
jgi:hypothetical protein